MRQLPRDDAAEVWSIQNELLLAAENLLGPRNPNIIICQPTFGQSGPFIQHRETNGTHVWAALSMAASGYWPTLRYELAHETVHLLNPVVGATTWLEEGIAVAFSIHVQRGGVDELITPPANCNYDIAWKLVENLPEPPFVFAKTVRSKFGSLCKFSAQDLISICPGLDLGVAAKLAETCIPR